MRIFAIHGTIYRNPGKGAVKTKYTANFITASRFVFAGLLLWARPFSALFWTWYLCGGLSDLLDGPVARMLHHESEAGAKLDSAADFVFLLCAAIAVARSTVFPVWALICALIVALVRFAAYGIGYFKYRTFSALHTVMNKAAGAFLFAFPPLYRLLGMGAACGIVCGVAFLSAAEELLLTIRSKELDRNRKSLFHRSGRAA